MSKCGPCSGSCSGCSGCTGSLELTQGELTFLQQLGQIPFLPVARKADSMEPVYLEDSDYSSGEYSLILQCLEKKQLITLDYSQPLARFDYAAYTDFPVRGTISLTARGQAVLDAVDFQGVL